jgi:hypothetical protein
MTSLLKTLPEPRIRKSHAGAGPPSRTGSGTAWTQDDGLAPAGRDASSGVPEMGMEEGRRTLRLMLDKCREALDRIERTLKLHTGEIPLEVAGSPAPKDDAPKVLPAGNPGARFRFSSRGHKIFLDGAYVTGKVQAQLLWNILCAHAQSRQSEYDYSRFKCSDRLFDNPKRTNFELRFQRISGILRRMNAPVELRRLTHGRFSVITRAEISLEEA